MTMQYVSSIQGEVDIKYIEGLVEKKLGKLKRERNAYKRQYKSMQETHKMFQEYLCEQLNDLRRENAELRKELESKK